LLLLLCLAAILWAVLHPAATALAWAILVPLLMFVAVAAIAPVRQPERVFFAADPFLPVYASRPPPCA